MALLNFKGRFVDPIEAGQKNQTIRNFRKYPIVPGETLYLYTGLRTKHTRKLGERICTEVRVIKIRKDSISTRLPIGGRWEQVTDLDAFAKSDGFIDWREMKKWWSLTHDLPFTGQLIKWQPI